MTDGDPNDVLDANNFSNAKVADFAMAERFGSLKFEDSGKKLEQIQAWLKDAEDLNFKEALSGQGVSRINKFIDKFVELLQWLSAFNIETSTNPKQEHDDFDSKVNAFFDDVQIDLSEKYLPVLWLKAARDTGDQGRLQEEIIAASKARQQSEEALKTLQEKLDEIEKQKKSVESGALSLGSARMAVYFDEEAKNYSEKSDQWFLYGRWGYAALAVIVAIAAYIFWNSDPGPLLLQRLALKAALFAVLWYGVAFIVRSHNVNAHLAAVNRHRAAVARTLEDFLSGNPERQSEMLRHATEAMFKHMPIGYVTKAEKDQGNPINEIVNNISRPN